MMGRKEEVAYRGSAQGLGDGERGLKVVACAITGDARLDAVDKVGVLAKTGVV